MSSTKQLDRTVFTFSRTLEYFDIKELQAQTGQPSHNFPLVVVKELIDNALDECEYARVTPPKIGISILEGKESIELQITDNGKGITPEVVEKILDFPTRTTTKAFYHTPTRGQLGNALKTVIGIPYALSKTTHEEISYPIVIESCGIKHVISVEEYAGKPNVKRETHESNIVGTTIKVKLPLTYEEDYYGNPLNSSIRDRIEHLYNSYALFNPHASFNYYHSDIDTHEELTTHTQDVIAEPAWRKFYPFDFPAPSWYDFDGFKNLIFAHINSDNIKPFGTFIREFKGLSASGKAKGISKRFKDVTTIADLTEENITDLLAAMKEATKPPLPSVLGIIGKDNLSKRIADLYPIEVFWYKKIDGYAGILPFVVEAIAATTSAEIGREIYTGLNFAPSYDDPFKDS